METIKDKLKEENKASQELIDKLNELTGAR